VSHFTTTVYPTDRDGQDWEINVRVDYDCDYQPAKVSGPPEDCYPEAGELDMTEITILDELPSMITDADVYAAAEDAKDRLDQEAWDHFHNRGVDDGA
jgi:hypothetical protein